MKIAINKCYGGFSISHECALLLRKKGVRITLEGDFGYYLRNEDFGIINDDYNAYRADPRLIEAIEESKNPSGRLSELKIVEIPDGTDWYIDEYDGLESIHECHREWG